MALTDHVENILVCPSLKMPEAHVPGSFEELL